MPPQTPQTDPYQNLMGIGNQIATSTQQQFDIPTQLRDAIAAKLSGSNPLVQNQNNALQQLYPAYEQASAKYAQPQDVTIGGGQWPVPGQNPVGDQATVQNVYLPPAQQRAAVASDVASKLIPVEAANQQLLGAYGGMATIIDRVANALKTQTAAKQAQFDTASKVLELYQNAYLKGLVDPTTGMPYNPTSGTGSDTSTVPGTSNFSAIPASFAAGPRTDYNNPASQPTIPLPSGLTTKGTGPQTSDANAVLNERAQVNALIKRLPAASPLIKMYTDKWNIEHPDFPLNPTALTPGEVPEFQATAQAVGKISHGMDLLNKPGVQTGGTSGLVADIALSNPRLANLMRNIPGLSNLTPSSDMADLFNTLLQLRALGEKTMVGGRLSGYLLNTLGASFAQLPKTPAENKKILSQALQYALQDLEPVAKAHGYSSAQELLQANGVTLPASATSKGKTASTGSRPSLDSFVSP